MSAASSSSDPIAEGFALLAGVALGLITVLVPLATVVGESSPPDARQTLRVGW